ncbi:response regulator transcription factor [Trinickia terrae]|uniref:response regulator transcription factor n=1 Tax=Trinickia terrae TaxID=2571161 RepID=UPI00146AB828|nr:response regulator transcription factor [Trinickia terrae]
MRKTNVVVADDHPVVAMGIGKVLEGRPDIRLVAAAASISELLETLQTKPCDILICDYSFAGDIEPDGMQLLERVRGLYPGLKIVVLTVNDSLAVVRRIMSLRVAGFVSKSSRDFHALPEVIERVMRGERYIDSHTSKMVVQRMLDSEDTSRAQASAQLTAREMEVVRMFASNMSVTDIAKHTNRSLKTISTQKSKAMIKLGASNDIELVNAFKQLY